MTVYISRWLEVAKWVYQFYNKGAMTIFGSMETYKLTLERYTFKVVNASAKQLTNNLHILLFFHLIYFQISQIYRIVLTEKC